MSAMRELMARSRVIPVVVVDGVGQAVDLARALLDGGLPVIEITLRTPEAMSAVEAVVRDVPGMTVGVGTVLAPEQLSTARDVGAAFAVSPGLDLDLVAAARGIDMPYLPGIQTSSEAMAARKAGLDALKFFPAKAAGGPGALKQLHPVYPDLLFCPTGGIGFADAPEYLSLANVACVGGSFPAPADLMAAADWAGITETAARAASLGGG
jgi:2-dehydro-3-deoxyphosphogluconate aldolase/(4S)-4-hydroxy-2-oxoglutarate aldolase